MLKGTGQKLGASGALCHIRRVSASNNMNQYTLHLGNVGDVEVVLCRRGEAVILTRKFVTTEDDEECMRVYQSDGIITEVRTSTPWLYDTLVVAHLFFLQVQGEAGIDSGPSSPIPRSPPPNPTKSHFSLNSEPIRSLRQPFPFHPFHMSTILKLYQRLV